jgi:membrane-associated phospholipid phosphatase
MYTAARGLFVGEATTARSNAETIIGLEQDLGLHVEASVQQVFDSSAAIVLLSNVYLAAQLVVLPASLIVTYRRAPGVYRRLRSTIIATWLISVPVFATFPVGPPRTADVGLRDTVSDQAAVALTGSSTLFYNPFAAVPSLHVGFAFAIGSAVAHATRRPLVRAAALLWGPLVSLAVVATGNHYLFDIAAGLLVTSVGYAVGRAVSSDVPRAAAARVRPRSALRREVRRRSISGVAQGGHRWCVRRS